MRDLLCKRSQLVRDRTTHILSVQNLVTRNSGKAITQAGIRKLDEKAIPHTIADGVAYPTAYK
ncbi:MAG: hypothetical protein HY952_03435 [Elusimicrobia bacterium]|nr:hypothetical protein [Elusimicrobiota bacterium]